MNRNVIGPNIKKIRNTKKITQEELTAKLQINGINIDRTMISKIENQTREIYDYEIISIAKALNIPIEHLFNDF